MKTKFIMIVLLLIISSSLVYAHETGSETDTTQYISDLENLRTLLNENLNRVPRMVQYLLGDETVNVHYTVNETYTVDFYLRLNSGLVSQLQSGSIQGATLEVTASQHDISDIMNAQDKRAEASRKLESGEINIQATRFLTRIKLRAARAFL